MTEKTEGLTIALQRAACDESRPIGELLRLAESRADEVQAEPRCAAMSGVGRRWYRRRARG